MDPFGAFDDKKVQEILNINEDWKPVAILPIGYPAKKPEKTSRRALEDITHYI